MNAIKTLAAWGCVAVLGVAGARFMGRIASLETNAAILMSCGILSAFVNAASFQVLRRLDDPPLEGLSPQGVRKLERKLLRRRYTFRFKWGFAIMTAFLAGVFGALLKVPSLAKDEATLLLCGYVGLGFAVTLGVLIAVEYSALSKLARELPKRLEEERRKQEMLQRLRADVPGAGDGEARHRPA